MRKWLSEKILALHHKRLLILMVGFFFFFLCALIVISFRKLGPTAVGGEMAQMRHYFLPSVLLLLLSFYTKTIVVILCKWGDLLQSIKTSFAAFSAPIVFFLIWFLAEGSDVNYNLLYLPGVIVWWHFIGFIFWLPGAIFLEGTVFYILSAKGERLRPWKTAIFSNLADFFVFTTVAFISFSF